MLLPLGMLAKAHMFDDRTQSRIGKDTRIMLGRLWKQIFVSEVDHERVRQRLLASLKGTLEEIWKEIDKNGSGQVTRDEIAKFLVQYGFHAMGRDVDLLMARYDRSGNRDSLISLTELVNGLRPRTSQMVI